MKLKSIAKLIKSKGQATLYSDVECEEQWLGVGDAIYLLTRLPWFNDIDTLFTVLDLSEKERDKIAANYSTLPKHLCFKDVWNGERPLLTSALTLALGELELIPARTSMGLRFFETQYLGPVSDMSDYDFIERRMDNDSPYIAVKQGLCIKALIIPDALEKTRLPEELQTLHSEMMTTMSYLASKPE